MRRTEGETSRRGKGGESKTETGLKGHRGRDKQVDREIDDRWVC